MLNTIAKREHNYPLFKLKWVFMSQRKRYAYLWLQTKEAELKKRRQLN